MRCLSVGMLANSVLIIKHAGFELEERKTFTVLDQSPQDKHGHVWNEKKDLAKAYSQVLKPSKVKQAEHAGFELRLTV